MRHLLDVEDGELNAWFKAHGQGGFRLRQVKHWLFQQRAADFAAMTNLPKSLREQLAAEFTVWTSRVIRHQTADDGTEKLLLEFAGGGQIECVLLRDGTRRSICISSQVGCAMGCVFCASGLDGVDRSLTRGEIVEQMLQLQRLLPPDERLSHIVVMGMGEPLANLDRLLPALDAANAADGLGISSRRITISTVGLPEAIERLTNRGAPYHLAVSLHAPDDALRDRLVRVNRNTGLARILAAADGYFERSGRRLTFEYVLLAELNDGPEHAQALVNLLRGRPALVNVIPYNPVSGLPYRTPAPERIRAFRQQLLQGGLNVQFRKRKGDKINAACGQLRRITQTSGPLTIASEPAP